MNALFLLNVDNVASFRHSEDSNNDAQPQFNIAQYILSTANAVLVRIVSILPVIGPLIHSADDPSFSLSFDQYGHNQSGESSSSVVEVKGAVKHRLYRQLLEPAVEQGDHDALRLLGNYFVLEATQACSGVKATDVAVIGDGNSESTSSGELVCFMEYYTFAFSAFQQSLECV